MTEMPPHVAIDQSKLVEIIKALHRARNDYHVSEKAMTLRIKSVCRRTAKNWHCGQKTKGAKCEAKLCKADQAEADRLYKAVNDRHNRESKYTDLLCMVDFLEKDDDKKSQRQCAKANEAIKAMQALDAQDDDRVLSLHRHLSPLLLARDVITDSRMKPEKQMKELAKQLPVYSWVESVSGVGELSLALIVGEAGNLSNYATHGKLFKRMGLAVINGQRQRKTTDKDLAGVMGYNPRRRSVSWQIAHSMFLAQSPRSIKETGEVTRPAGPYRLIYDEYKARKTAERPDLKPIVINNMAQRYMEKMFIKDLWRAWREVSG